MKYLIGFFIAFGLSMNCQADQNGDSNVTQPVYKILREQEWKEFQSQGHFDGSTDDKKSGFIHLSPVNQIERIINKYFATERTVYIVKFSNAEFLKRLAWESASGGDLYPHLYNGSLDSKDIESFEVRDSSNKEPSSQKCIGLTEAQVIIRQYMSSLVGANFNEDFPWLLEKRQITAEHVSWAFSGLSWSRNQSKYFTGALVSQDIVDLGPAEWGEYSVDCQGVIRAEYFSE